ncbi:hypothetical protein [Amycolatopsis albispora]|uniref:Uncharacterized protein n=1 Tax=Amycolatopsis albispora TaxID=1804986 RepID=A0A344L0R2_9PSEU|nr:hypothetical protein [Amycolatopsis albispora]AXB41636.1 hypothetical protein A4R43_03145 [Amycolatopsis albispora]
MDGGGRRRLGWVLAALTAAVAVVSTGVVLLVSAPGEPDAGEFAGDVAEVLTQGGDEPFRAVFCESAVERRDGVDVFALVRPITVTVQTVVNESDTHALAVLAIDKERDRVFLSMDKQQPGWCVSAIHLCTPAAEPSFDPPRLPCAGLLGRD